MGKSGDVTFSSRSGRSVARVLALCLFFLSFLGSAHASQVLVLEFKGVLNPPMAHYLVSGLEKAASSGAAGVLILIDTPGGLDPSMREVVKAIMNSPVPVITFVYPSGSRAASAGLFVLEAGHIAAMAPGTNTGAAHPVSMGGKMGETMKEKVANDALAFVKSIARERGRNPGWLEEAVLASSSVTAREALKLGVIDVMASSPSQLLEEVDGRKVKVAGREVVLKLKGSIMKRVEPTMKERVLYFLSMPNVAYILAVLGFYGLLFELSNPGLIFPGIVGVIFLILSFYSFHTLPLNYAGVFLIIFGVGLMVLDIKVPSHGLLTLGGVLSFFLGSVMLVDAPVHYLKLSLKVILPVAVFTALFIGLIVAAGLRAQLKKPVSGAEGLVGEEGETKTRVNSQGGQVFVHGEIWRAVSSAPLLPGTKVRVVGVKGLILEVEPLEEESRGS
ncbi:MAG TPA: nodulation protein NfeD [Thermosulfidibacter takaii]|uniref:Nodulation protein NfeD n=1 Tax=Thermosulfidibacter takaii TaxID=412593 RepID=A0A7C0Y763_9BACT|nr:nodulation protein NfeD [Thermosulfidibacter takaii]